MTFDVNPHGTYINPPGDERQIVNEAVITGASSEGSVVGSSIYESGQSTKGKSKSLNADKAHGLNLARLGIRLLGSAFAVAAIWFVCAWIYHGEVPLGLLRSRINLSLGGRVFYA